MILIPTHDCHHFGSFWQWRSFVGVPDVSSLMCVRLLLRVGAEINRCGRIGFDFLLTRTEVKAARKLQAHMKPVGQLLFAAGETQLIKDLTYQEPEVESLMGMCRERIRAHLLRLDAHAHLFHRVRRLGLPAALQRYIVFNQTIDETEDEQNKKLANSQGEVQKPRPKRSIKILKVSRRTEN